MGSTKDLFAQVIKATLTESAANTYTETEIETPVVIFGQQAEVMEITKLVVSYHLEGASGDKINWHLTDDEQSAVQSIADDGCLFAGSTLQVGAVYQKDMPIVYDLTDGGGKGVLYGKENLWLGIVGTSLVAAGGIDIQIFYRMKRVGLRDLYDMIRGE